ncbi:hypothetical protein TNCT_253911 [Trichonephila clavata]|uniref:Uncharacterized protein n=1 Tax=Trichonephila clavata TaxID=2740835 RepID=A0A8X6HSP4_TRICU|nr:hypothetical protein TNCT_253911 [Trichonephila clavata]
MLLSSVALTYRIGKCSPTGLFDVHISVDELDQLDPSMVGDCCLSKPKWAQFKNNLAIAPTGQLKDSEAKTEKLLYV